MNRSTIVGRRVSSCVLAKVAIVKLNPHARESRN